MSAAIASIPAHPLSASLVTQMGGAGSTLRATIERKGSAVLLYAVGEVDAANETIWRRLLGEAATATAAPGPLIIDVNGLDFMAGCAYAALAEQADRCRIRGINLCLVSTHRIVARVVGVMKLDRQVPLYHNVDAALMATISWISPRRNIASNASPKSEPMAAPSRPTTPIQKWPTMRPFAPATMAIAVLLFSGCSASEVINTGGDTKCKDFTAQDEKKQNDEISKMLKDKSGAEPNNLEISATRLSALTYCQTLGTEDSKISEAPHG